MRNHAIFFVLLFFLKNLFSDSYMAATEPVKDILHELVLIKVEHWSLNLPDLKPTKKK